MLIFNHFSPNLPSFTGFQRFSFVFHTFFTWVTKLYRFWAHWTTSDQIGSSFTEFYRVLPSFTEFYRVWSRFTTCSLGFTEFLRFYQGPVSSKTSSNRSIWSLFLCKKKLSQVFLQLQYSFNEEIHLLHGPPFFLIKKTKRKPKKRKKVSCFFYLEKPRKLFFLFLLATIT